MNISSILIAILYVVFFNCKTISTKTWSEASEDKCKFTVNHEDDIYFSENPLLFIRKFGAKDIHDCRKICCNHESCNGYVWDGNDNFENCRLLKCSNEGTDCKQALRKVPNNVDKRMHEVGFITGVNNPEPSIGPSPISSTLATSMPTVHIASTTTKSQIEMVQTLKEMLEAATQRAKENNTTTGIRISSNDKKEMNNNRNSPIQFADPLVLNSPKATTKTTITTPTPTTTTIESTIINPTRRPVQRLTGVIETNTGSNHTDNISMSVALIFGVIFLIATFYFVGKRWIEGWKDSHKRGYTRISYLLNGV